MLVIRQTEPTYKVNSKVWWRFIIRCSLGVFTDNKEKAGKKQQHWITAKLTGQNLNLPAEWNGKKKKSYITELISWKIKVLWHNLKQCCI